MKNSNYKKVLLVIVGLILALFTFAQSNITVKVTDVDSNEGQLIFRLFASDEGFPASGKQAFRQALVVAQKGSMSHTFKEVPPGFYAISVAHDENKNNEVDRNFIGMPKERVGVSNQIKFGKPNFERSKIEIRDEKEIIVDLQFIN